MLLTPDRLLHFNTGANMELLFILGDLCMLSLLLFIIAVMISA